MIKWTDEVDAVSAELFKTLTTAQIRKRQSICAWQKEQAFEQRNEDALADLDRMENALTREMMRRCC